MGFCWSYISRDQTRCLQDILNHFWHCCSYAEMCFISAAKVTCSSVGCPLLTHMDDWTTSWHSAKGNCNLVSAKSDGLNGWVFPEERSMRRDDSTALVLLAPTVNNQLIRSHAWWRKRSSNKASCALYFLFCFVCSYIKMYTYLQKGY